MSRDVVLGFDFGTRRIGIAIGNRLTGSSRALTSIATPGNDAQWSALDQLLSEWKPDRLVVGIPTHMDKTEQPITQLARDFAAALGARYSLPVDEVDERLSSIAAETELREARSHGVRARRNRRGDLDSVAAAVLVEQWLNS